MAFKYDSEEWIKRIRNRSDMSSYLVHLTRKNDQDSGTEVLKQILEQGKLKKSSNEEGFIVGNEGAVCFQDVPLYSACQNSFYEQTLREDYEGMKIRYQPLGLAFRKDYVFKKGGRPVVYEQKDVAKSILPKEEWYRIVNFDLSDTNQIIDWTHEREWRVKGDFVFDISQAIVLLAQHKAYDMFLNTVDDEIIDSVAGITVLDPILS